MSFYSWRPYVSVAQRRAKAQREMEKLRKKGKDIQPIEIDGRKIAKSFWGEGWCDHLESFSDFENRLPRGRTYVRNGSVCHLEVQAGRIEAFVSGSELYKVSIGIKPLVARTWKEIKSKCHGQVGSLLELLQGKLSDHVMAVVSDRKQGLFPQPGEIELTCSCPDWATMCKHVAAVLYGVGNRLDHRPELLFVLRGVDAEELISAEVSLSTTAAAGADALDATGLADIFGVDIDAGEFASTTKRTGERTAKPTAPNGRPKAKTPEQKKAATNGRKPKKAAARKRAKPAFDPAAPTGEGVAALRRQSDLSAADFAHRLGVTAQSVQRWEGTRGPLRIYARPLAALTRLQQDLGDA